MREEGREYRQAEKKLGWAGIREFGFGCKLNNFYYKGVFHPDGLILNQVQGPIDLEKFKSSE